MNESLRELLPTLASKVVEDIEHIGMSTDDVVCLLQTIEDLLACDDELARVAFASGLHREMARCGSAIGLEATRRLLREHQLKLPN